jgi:hypothetical protein
MTAPVWIRAAIGLEWHRLTVIGIEHHGVTCALGAVPTDEPALISTDPPADEPRCVGCDRDLEIKRARVPTVDLRPRTWTGDVADIEVADVAIPRAITVEW